MSVGATRNPNFTVNPCQPRIFTKQEINYCENDDFLGSGGFGIVYRCYLANPRKLVAVKVFKMPQRLQQMEEKSFVQKAYILQRLVDCPYIVRFLGLCIDPGHYAIIMEHVEYGDLENLLLHAVEDHPAIKQWDCRIRMAQEIAKGMEYLHSLEPPIIHRDLKTKNVLVGHKYLCKIIDFGLAKVRNISTQITGNCVKGTVAFTAPELFNAEVQKGNEMKIDVYSYAMILWQLKEMKQLYVGLKFEVVRINVLAGQRPALSDDDSIKEYNDVIVCCWDTKPADRLNFKDIVHVLDGIMSQMNVRLRCSDTPSPPREDARALVPSPQRHLPIFQLLVN
ncbi:probable serine/threonine-protein kinase DDB_G0271682 isoform X2 [Corticium candelabrum]|uniref:probable serine/threonine-protein kinase DDB_G0271682 isoform X2 n=1 Tax=Corticium candelabrum TaxID=121492 RepID=UPI002E27686B|nr:probable serine/threonine-protein kinase DDB_G0271682 isoform X2 [Corticium candelabrum]